MDPVEKHTVCQNEIPPANTYRWICLYFNTPPWNLAFCVKQSRIYDFYLPWAAAEMLEKNKLMANNQTNHIRFTDDALRIQLIGIILLYCITMHYNTLVCPYASIWMGPLQGVSMNCIFLIYCLHTNEQFSCSPAQTMYSVHCKSVCNDRKK